MLGVTTGIPTGITKRKSFIYLCVLLLLVTMVGMFHISSNIVPSGLLQNDRETGMEQGCYWLHTASDQKELSEEKLKERNCTKSFPDAIIIGTKKCGTTALRNFLTFHPQVATSKAELHFFEARYYLGMHWYLNQMPYATPDQITVEKTPRYFIHPLSPSTISTHLGPNVKFILILRDPVQRAISDFAHVFETKATNLMKEENEGEKPPELKSLNTLMKEVIVSLENTMTDEQRSIRNYVQQLENKYKFPSVIKDTFEETVLLPDGSINTKTAIVDTGIYSKYMKKWLAFFPPERFLVLDGEEFVYNPLPALQKVENYLNLSNFFTHDSFYFDMNKRFFCLAQPFRSCMNKAKGRPHPIVDEDVLGTLRAFYRPYNLELKRMLNLDFPWLSA